MLFQATNPIHEPNTVRYICFFLGNHLYILKGEKMKGKIITLPIHCSPSSFIGKSKV